MAKILAGAALEVDLATLGDLDRHFKHLALLLERPHARYHRLAGARAPRAGNAPFVIKLDTPRPPTGWLWEIQWALLMGDDPGTAVAIANVRAMLIVGAAPPDSSIAAGAVAAPWGGIDYPGVVINGLAIPTPGPVTIPDRNVCHTDEEIYAVVGGTGTVAGAAFYHLTVGVLEKPQTAEALTW